MRKKGFLARLRDEGTLRLVEPSNEIKEAYTKKSESYLASAKLLLENDKLEESISMAYYSMYYAALTLFFRTGIKCENHSAAVILLEEIFDLDNSAISSAKKERIDKQYYVDFSIVKVDVKETVRIAERFNAEILDFTDKLNSEKIEGFRERMRKLLERG